MQQILNDVYCINTGTVNCYLIRDGESLCLIDTGMPNDARKIVAAIEELNQTSQDLTHILLTHADIDHAGGLSALLKECEPTVYASTETAELIAQGRSPRHLPRLMQFIGDIFFRYPRVAMDKFTTVQEGDTLPIWGGLEVLATPGHTLDHLSFYSPAADILFAGDILNTREGRLQRTPVRITADETAANQSALRLVKMAPAVFACGHGNPLTGDTSSERDRLTREIEQQKGG